MSNFKFSSLTENDWPEWNIEKTSRSIVAFDGQHIQRIFHKISVQLETLRSLSIEQGEILQQNSIKIEEHHENIEKIHVLEASINQYKIDSHKQSKEIELLRYQQHDLVEKITLQNEYIDKIHLVLDQQSRMISTLENKFKELNIQKDSFHPIQQTPIHQLHPIASNTRTRDDLSLEKTVVLDIQPATPPRPQLKNLSSFHSTTTKDAESQTNMPLLDRDSTRPHIDMSLVNLDAPSWASSTPVSPTNEVSINEEIQHESSSRPESLQNPFLTTSSQHSEGGVTMSCMTPGGESRLDNIVDQKNESNSLGIESSLTKERQIIQMNNQSISNPPTPISRPMSAAPSMNSVVNQQRYDILLHRVNTLAEELTKFQNNNSEEIKGMKQKLNKKFHEMHDWVLNFINQNSQHTTSLENSKGHTVSTEHHGTISIFQCPECYRLSKSALSEEGLVIPLQSTISHTPTQTMNNNNTSLTSKKKTAINLQQKYRLKSLSTTNIDMNEPINHSNDCHKHRLDLNIPSSSSSSSGLWWNMVER